MSKKFNYKIYFNFLNILAKQLTRFYYSKLDKPFKISNKLKGKGYDPVTTSDKAFERFIRKKILERFPDHQIIGEEYGLKKTKLNVNSKVSIKNAKIAAAFHGYLSFSKQKKIQKFIKIVNFPCFDALTYAQLAEGRLDIVVQCANKIWDVHAIIPIISAAGGTLTTWKNENGKLAGNHTYN